MKTIGIVGGAGYTAGELIRLLLHHPKVKIDFVFSTSHAGQPLTKAHQDLFGDTSLSFTDTINLDVDVLFLCLGHGHSKGFLEKNTFASHTKIIDLSNDFRLQEDSNFQGRQYIYGLPEVYRSEIITAEAIANPGCFATCIQLSLLPLAAQGILQSDIHINATTGSTGAGVSLSPTAHFSWRDNNFSSYKVFSHQHLGEIKEQLRSLQMEYQGQVFFIPNRGNFSRGIFATAYTDYEGDIESAYRLYSDYYEQAVYTHLSQSPLHLKQVINTNKCLIHLQKYEDKLLVTGVIDNLLKGASGQAVQNMNLMFGYDERLGLILKPSVF